MQNRVNTANLRLDFFHEQIDCMDAPESIPAGAHFGGDAEVYTGAMYVKRPGEFSKAEIDAFSALFE